MPPDPTLRASGPAASVAAAAWLVSGIVRATLSGSPVGSGSLTELLVPATGRRAGAHRPSRSSLAGLAGALVVGVVTGLLTWAVVRAGAGRPGWSWCRHAGSPPWSAPCSASWSAPRWGRAPRGRPSATTCARRSDRPVLGRRLRLGRRAGRGRGPAPLRHLARRPGRRAGAWGGGRGRRRRRRGLGRHGARPSWRPRRRRTQPHARARVRHPAGLDPAAQLVDRLPRRRHAGRGGRLRGRRPGGRGRDGCGRVGGGPVYLSPHRPDRVRPGRLAGCGARHRPVGPAVVALGYVGRIGEGWSSPTLVLTVLAASIPTSALWGCSTAGSEPCRPLRCWSGPSRSGCARTKASSELGRLDKLASRGRTEPDRGQRLCFSGTGSSPDARSAR